MRSPDAKGGELLPFGPFAFLHSCWKVLQIRPKRRQSQFRAGEKKTKGSFLLKKDPL